MKWKMQKSEIKLDGNYLFSGKFKVSDGAKQLLSLDEISTIQNEICAYAIKQNGIEDYVEYVNEETNEKLVLLDQLDKDDLDKGSKIIGFEKYNYCTLMLYWEF